MTTTTTTKPVALVKPMIRTTTLPLLPPPPTPPPLPPPEMLTSRINILYSITWLYKTFLKISTSKRRKYDITYKVLKRLALSGFYCCDPANMSIKCWYCKLIVFNYFTSENTNNLRHGHCKYSFELNKLN